MIITMKKLVVLGAKKDRTTILEKLQEIGAVHVVSANVKKVKSRLEDIEEIEKTAKVISILRDLDVEKQKTSETTLPENIVNNTLLSHSKKQKLLVTKEEISQRIEALKMWGDFSMEEWDTLRQHNVSIQFCRIAAKNLSDLNKEQIVYQKQISKDIFVVLLSHEQEINLPDNATSIKIKKGTIELQKEQHETNAEIEKITKDIEKEKCYLPLLEQSELDLQNKANFQVVENKLFYQNEVFALEGYIPETENIEEKIQSIPAAIVISETTDNDEPPTLIQNPKWIQSVVDLVKIYAIPGYKEWDTSASIYFAFTIFFAMIVGDAGYGCTLLGIMLLLAGKLRKSEAGQRFFRLMVTLSVACIIFGALGGNWFAIELAADNPLKQIQIMNNGTQEENLNSMMMLSLCVGATHITMARLIHIIRIFPSAFWLNQLGWLLMMWGAMAKILWDKDYGMYVLCTGAGMAVIFATTHRNIFKRIGLGMMDLLGLTQNFADVLSYLRLFALGLASTVMAKIFNDLGMQVKEAVPSFGIILMVLIIFLGHTINLGLAIMGGFIHGLRLNFLEFYRYCFEGTGYDYEPFSKKA